MNNLYLESKLQEMPEKNSPNETAKTRHIYSSHFLSTLTTLWTLKDAPSGSSMFSPCFFPLLFIDLTPILSASVTRLLLFLTRAAGLRASFLACLAAARSLMVVKCDEGKKASKVLVPMAREVPWSSVIVMMGIEGVLKDDEEDMVEGG